MTTPERTNNQRLEALKIANKSRTDRAILKAQIKSGHVHLTDVLANPPRCAHSARVGEIIGCKKGVGEVKVARVLYACRISPRRTMVGLTERQRKQLIATVENIGRTEPSFCECGSEKHRDSANCMECHWGLVAA